MYIGFDGFVKMHFTLQNSKSRDAYVGHDVKTRAPFNYILNNEIRTAWAPPVMSSIFRWEERPMCRAI